jgi:hypothetical protein
MKKVVAAIALSIPLVASAADNSMLILSGDRSLAIPGFRTYIATGYIPSEKNVEFLKTLKEKTTSLKLISFDQTNNNKNMLVCRASYPVYGPNKTPFASLIEAAVNMELVASGLSAPEAPRIQASLDDFDFSSFGTGKWSIDATFATDGKAPLVIKNQYTFPVSAGAVSGCGDVMNAMVAGIESFLLRLYSDPGFIELVR